MRHIIALIPLTFLLPGTVAAQVDDAAMEVQRCVWRCLSEFGHSSAYEACVAAHCNDPAPAPEPSFPASTAMQVLPPAVPQPPPAPGPGVLSGVWTYGPHPELGPSAHIDTAAGSIGLGCGTGPAPLGLRIASGLTGKGRFTVMFSPDRDVVTRPAMRGDWAGQDGGACDVHVDALATAQALYILPADATAFRSDGPDLVITMNNGQRSIDIRSTAEAFAAFGGYVVPLTGAHQAIGGLLAACPAARQSVAEGCGD